jgi:RNA polymerase sigma-70 factor (sigma-E family)
MDGQYASFVTSRYLTLVRRSYLLTGDYAAAEDLVQDVLAGRLVAWRRGAVADPDRYVGRALTNRAISRWRRRGHAEVLTEHLPESAELDVEAQRGSRDALWRAMQQLPARQRAVLVLRYFEDLPDAEIAYHLGVAPATVRSLAARGLRHLRSDVSLRADAEGVG